MGLDLFVKLKNESSTIILFLSIRYSMRDLLSDLNNYAWPANYSSDMRQIRQMMSALPLAAARLSNSKLWILCLNDLLDGYLCKKIFYFHIFPFFLVFKHDFFSDELILPVSQLTTQQVMTSQIRSHIEYLVHTCYIFLLSVLTKLMKNLASMAVFIRFNDDTW